MAFFLELINFILLPFCYTTARGMLRENNCVFYAYYLTISHALLSNTNSKTKIKQSNLPI
jgi:hypothetical protein